MTKSALPPLRDVIAKYGLSARKSLGQNFLLDLNLTGRIARSCGDISNSTVLEIGPGPGGLTRALLEEGAKRVIAIERDDRCLPLLQEISTHYDNRLQVVADDALKADYRSLLGGENNVQIAANLPYGISTALLTNWLQEEPWPPWFSRMTLMFQKEVAERIVAPPGNKTYGRLSVLSQWRTDPKIVFKLPPRAFTPPPKVESAVVSFVPKDDPQPHCSAQNLQQITAAAFGQRRKMIKKSLKQLTPSPEKLLEQCKINPMERAENLSVQDFCKLAAHLENDTQ